MSLAGLPANQMRPLPTEINAKYFGGQNMYRYGVRGDGTCFFYSICAALNKDNFMNSTPKKQIEIGQRFRCAFTDNLSLDDWQKFERKHNYNTGYTLEKLKRKFCQPSVWADQPVIQYTIEALNLNIIFLDDRMRRLFCGVHGKSTNRPSMVILWLNHSHFEPVVRVNSFDLISNRIQVQMLFHPSKDKAIIGGFMSAYTHECRVTLNDFDI
jgi:hypothetical protein